VGTIVSPCSQRPANCRTTKQHWSAYYYYYYWALSASDGVTKFDGFYIELVSQMFVTLFTRYHLTPVSDATVHNFASHLFPKSLFFLCQHIGCLSQQDWVRLMVMIASVGCNVVRTGKTTDGLAVTSAGELPSSCIIHLATPPAYDRKASKNWHERIIKCLEKVEAMKMNSVAFPLLGTGKWHVQCSPLSSRLNVALYGVGLHWFMSVS